MESPQKLQDEAYYSRFKAKQKDKSSFNLMELSKRLNKDKQKPQNETSHSFVDSNSDKKSIKSNLQSKNEGYKKYTEDTSSQYYKISSRL